MSCLWSLPGIKLGCWSTVSRAPVVFCPCFSMLCVSLHRLCVFMCVRIWICMSFRDQFLTASISYCQHYCLWHSFISRKTGSRDGCLALLSQWLQLTWPWMCIDVLVCNVGDNVCVFEVCMSVCVCVWEMQHVRAGHFFFVRQTYFPCRLCCFECLWYFIDRLPCSVFFYKIFFCLCDWRRETACGVTRAQKLQVGCYKRSPFCSNKLHLTLFSLEFVCTLLTFTPSSPLPFPFPPKPSHPLHFLPPPQVPLLPSSVCFCSLDSLSMPTSSLSLSNCSPSLFTMSAWLQKRGYGQENKGVF